MLRVFFVTKSFVCLQSFALLSDKLVPLVDGVKQNRERWLEIAAQQSLVPVENHERDTNDNVSKQESNPGSPKLVQNCNVSD